MNRAGRKPSSLVVRLLVGSLLALFLALALVGLVVDRAYTSAALSAMQERLESTAFLVLAALELDARGQPMIADTLAEARLERPGSDLHAGAMTPFGEWRSRSLVGVVNQPNVRLIERGTELFRGPEAGGNWHIWAQGLGWELPGGEIVDLTIWAAEHPDRLADSIAAFRAEYWRWLALAAALVVLVQLVMLAVLLRPLRRVAREVAEVEQGQRHHLGQDYPRELEPLTANLNALLETERANAEQYQRALGDLAHSLKTPLAVISARLSEREDELSESIRQSVNDMQHRVRHELDRAARTGRRTMQAPVAVAPVLRRVADSVAKLYPESTVKVEAAEDLRAHLAERDLMELAGNLIENAAKHGGRHIRVEAVRGAAGRRRWGFELVVEDDGPGMDDEDFERLIQRGNRGDERAEGQGFGLAIVERIVTSYGGKIGLERSALGGARIRVSLPPRY